MSRDPAGENGEKKKGGCLKTGLIILAVILVIALIVGIIAYRQLKVEYDNYMNESAGQQVAIMGEEVPDFTVTTTDGEEVTLSDLIASHEVTVLNIFTSWCGPCQREFPEMEKVYKKYQDKLAILALTDEEEDTMEIISDYKKDLGLTFMMGLDEGKTDSIPVSGYPTTVIIDRNGKVVFCQSGTIPEEEIVEKLYTSFMGDDYDGSPVFMYTAMVADRTQGVEGAVVRFTSDGDTQEVTTDADGFGVIFVNAPAKYQVTLESLPDGYKAKVDETSVGPESGWATFTVE